MDNTNYDEELHLQKAIIYQDAIGWRHFIQNRITVEGGNKINAHLDANKIKDCNAEKWGAKLLVINWKHIQKYGDKYVTKFTELVNVILRD